MFNVGAGEMLGILLLALIVLGPDKLPGAARQAGKYLAEFRRMSQGFQQEFRSAMDLSDVIPGSPAAEAQANNGTGNFTLPAVDTGEASGNTSVDTGAIDAPMATPAMAEAVAQGEVESAVLSQVSAAVDDDHHAPPVEPDSAPVDQAVRIAVDGPDGSFS